MTTLKDQMEIGRAITMNNRVRGIKPVKQLENQIEMLISQMTLVASQRDDAVRQLQDTRAVISERDALLEGIKEVEERVDYWRQKHADIGLQYDTLLLDRNVAMTDAKLWRGEAEKLRKELAELKEAASMQQNNGAELLELRKELAELRLQVISDIGQEIDAEPLPGADWTVTMRRMINSGCSKRECTCKPEDAPNCIWWDEPGDRPEPTRSGE